MPDPVEDTKLKEDPIDILDVSDEDFMKMEVPEAAPVEDEPDLGEEDSRQAEKEEEQDGKKEDAPAGDEKEPVVDDEPEPEKDEVIPDGSDDVKKTPVDGTPETDPKKETKDVDTPAVDYEAEYKKLTAPFKANGREMSINNVDDAIALMQMGANYHKKMAGLKPSLKTLKLLEKNDLLDPGKLNYLIDLHNKNPEAITKLLKDSGIDPLDVDVKTDSTYKPTNRSVSDTEVELDEVLDSIKDTPTYSKTLNVMTKEWDDASKNAAANQPNIISIINGHIADGTYDTVMNAVNYERSLGKLQGVSDLEAYKQVGDILHAAGKLGTPAPKPASADVTPAAKPGPSKEELKRKERKRAASPTKTTATTSAKPFNPLTLSDEEFEKFDPKKFIKR